MNTPLLTPQDAFNAMLAGKHVFCRPAGDMLDFRDLDEFPATIFAKPDYEFCIKIEMIEVAGIEFTKPLVFDDLVEGQKLYIVNTFNLSICVAEFGKTPIAEIIRPINSGFAQRDVENAKLQLQALTKTLSRELVGSCDVVDLDEKPKTTRKAKSKPTPVVVQDAQNTTSDDAVEKTSQSNIEITKVTGTTAVEDNLVTFQPSPNKEASLVAQMKNAESKHELYALLPELRSLHGEAGHRVMVVYEAEEKRFELFEDLMQRAAKAQTPAEANALIKYTSTWTEEQRKPLMTAIHKRLLELAPETEEPAPSILRDIENAPDLTALDALEIDISSRDPQIQKTLMAEITKRRVFLESQGVV